MRSSALRSDFLLLLTSMIWGFSFVAQRQGMLHIGPFTFNGIRFALGSLSLLPLIIIMNRRRPKVPLATKNTEGGLHKESSQTGDCLFAGNTLFCGFMAGLVLFLAASLQQIGIVYTSAGKAGFITGLYVVLVPIFALILGKKTGPATWIGTVLAAAGLYFLSAIGSMGNVNPGDIFVAVGAVFWSIHVLLIDAFVRRVDALKLSASQFAWCALFSLLVALIREEIQLDAIHRALYPILYGGLGSVGIAYTLQVVAQKHAPPAHSAIILSLEGAFATLGGIVLLSETLSLSNGIGSFLMLCGMLVTQWEVIGTMAGRKRKAVR